MTRILAISARVRRRRRRATDVDGGIRGGDVIDVAARATHARTALIEIVSTMSAHVVAEASITLDLAGPSWSEHGISVDPRASGALRDALEVLANAARACRGASGGLDQERRPLHHSDRRE